MDTNPHLEEILAVLEAHIAGEPGATESRFQRAGALTALGRVEEAKQAYLDVLQRQPTHFGAWTDLGRILFETGFTGAARTAYNAAVHYHPDNPVAQGNIAEIHLNEGNLEAALTHYQLVLKLQTNNIRAHQGLAAIFLGMGDEKRAQYHRHIGFHNRLHNPLPFRGQGAPIELLVFIAAACANIHWHKLIDDKVFRATTLVPECYDRELPPHQLIFNVIGDADLCQSSLEAARDKLKKTHAPVINHPTAVMATGRTSNAQRLGQLPGVNTARMTLLPKTILIGPSAPRELAGSRLDFPLLLRSPGFHAGHHFVYVERPEDLATAAERLPGSELMALEFLDSRSADGKIRKYRVMFIDGRLYPLHLAISGNWKVHYYSADMLNRPDHQAEEAAFLRNMPAAIGAQTMVALENINKSLGLDYAGIDFGIGRDGRVLVFEANATMNIIAPGSDPQWDYRRAAICEAFNAAQKLVLDRASQGELRG